MEINYIIRHVHVKLLFRNSSSTQEEHRETEELVQTDQSEEEEELGQTVEEIITTEQLDEQTETSSGTSEVLSEESNEEQEEEEEVTMAELELLKKLEEANRLIECDTKSLSCLSVGAVPKSGSGHSRTPSIASQESHGQEPGDDLWVMWSDILKSWDRRKGGNVKELVRQGIPHHFRGMAWQVLCEAHQSPDKAKYSGLLRTQSACEKVIRFVSCCCCCCCCCCRCVSQDNDSNDNHRQARHCPDLPGARVLQEEGRRGPGVPLQRDEGLQHPRQGGWLLPGQRLHRGSPVDGGE